MGTVHDCVTDQIRCHLLKASRIAAYFSRDVYRRDYFALRMSILDFGDDGSESDVDVIGYRIAATVRSSSRSFVGNVVFR